MGWMRDEGAALWMIGSHFDSYGIAPWRFNNRKAKYCGTRTLNVDITRTVLLVRSTREVPIFCSYRKEESYLYNLILPLVLVKSCRSLVSIVRGGGMKDPLGISCPPGASNGNPRRYV